MASINLVTGYTGEAHIKSEDDALLNSFLAGQDNSVINLDGEFNDTDCDISCDALVGGRLTRTDGAVNLTFTKPSSGYYRYDGVYIVYKKVTSGIESAELVYCEGTENASQSGAEQNIGQPTIGADVVASSVLQLYTVAWDNAQTKTVTANIGEGKTSDEEIAAMGGAFFNDGDIVEGVCYCAGVLNIDSQGSVATITMPLPKSLREGQSLVDNLDLFYGIFYWHDGTRYVTPNYIEFVDIVDLKNNWCTLNLGLNDITSSKSGACTARIQYSFTVTR